METLFDQVMVCPGCQRLSMGGGALELCPADGRAHVPRTVWRAHPGDELLGRVLDGRYALLDVLDAGARTYLGVQLATGRKVSVRVARTALAGGEWSGMRVFEEMRHAAELASPATVIVHDGGEFEGLTYAVFELLRGRSLAEVVATGGPLSESHACHIGVQLLHALREAHAVGLYHGDLRAERVVQVEQPFHENRVKLVGFGLARLDRPQARPDAAADLHALGRLLDLLVTGGVCGSEARDPSRLSGPLASFIARATALDPTLAFRTAEEMDRAIRELVPETVLPPSTSPGDLAPPRRGASVWRTAIRWDDVAVAAGSLLIGALLTLGVLAVSDPPGPTGELPPRVIVVGR